MMKTFTVTIKKRVLMRYGLLLKQVQYNINFDKRINLELPLFLASVFSTLQF